MVHIEAFEKIERRRLAGAPDHLQSEELGNLHRKVSHAAGGAGNVDGFSSVSPDVAGDDQRLVGGQKRDSEITSLLGGNSSSREDGLFLGDEILGKTAAGTRIPEDLIACLEPTFASHLDDLAAEVEAQDIGGGKLEPIRAGHAAGPSC